MRESLNYRPLSYLCFPDNLLSLIYQGRQKVLVYFALIAIIMGQPLLKQIGGLPYIGWRPLKNPLLYF